MSLDFEGLRQSISPEHTLVIRRGHHGDRGEKPLTVTPEREYSVGERAAFTRTITETDIVNFAGVTGDFNPVHIDEEYARGTPFKGRIAHGLLSAALISAVLGNKLPGPGCIYLKQELIFLAPVRIGDTITAEVEIMEINGAGRRMRLGTRCLDQGGKVVLDGEALVKY